MGEETFSEFEFRELDLYLISRVFFGLDFEKISDLLCDRLTSYFNEFVINMTKLNISLIFSNNRFFFKAIYDNDD